ncbi:c-type cytochrome [Sulfuricurvum sp.]|uniref:c-type cytochrome n=1 Tax=Sulfuricurvum sp. TaxID=2025608 RepID=UPI003C6B0B09
MRMFYATVALTLLAGSTLLNAATYKGQKIYMDSCKECHGGGQELAGSKKQRVWEKLMDDKGEKLADIHLSSKKAQASWEYFKGRSYTKGAKHLEDFLVEYAADSGNVPACN